MPQACASSSVSKTLASLLYDVKSFEAYIRSRLCAQPPIRLPPIKQPADGDVADLAARAGCPAGMSVLGCLASPDGLWPHLPARRPGASSLRCWRGPRRGRPLPQRLVPENTAGRFCLPSLVTFSYEILRAVWRGAGEQISLADAVAGVNRYQCCRPRLVRADSEPGNIRSFSHHATRSATRYGVLRFRASSAVAGKTSAQRACCAADRRNSLTPVRYVLRFSRLATPPYRKCERRRPPLLPNHALQP